MNPVTPASSRPSRNHSIIPGKAHPVTKTAAWEAFRDHFQTRSPLMGISSSGARHLLTRIVPGASSRWTESLLPTQTPARFAPRVFHEEQDCNDEASTVSPQGLRLFTDRVNQTAHAATLLLFPRMVLLPIARSGAGVPRGHAPSTPTRTPGKRPA